MDSLRLILLVVGFLFIVCIYLWDIFFKSEPKKRENILDAVDEIPDMPLYNLKNEDEVNYSSAMADLGSMLDASRFNSQSEIEVKLPELIPEKEIEPDQESNSEVSISANMSVKDFEESVPEDHDFDVFAAVHQEIEENDPSFFEHLDEEVKEEDDDIKPIIEDSSEKKTLGNVSDDILVLFITSPAHTLFNGLSISKAADEVGMIYGHMNIFHHFGPGKLHSGQPLFSMANMFEPGSFDLGRMSDLKTKGIAIFMYSPASIEPVVVFELFLNTTQRIAKLLGGEVRTVDNELLNSTKIKQLRDKAEKLSAE